MTVKATAIKVHRAEGKSHECVEHTFTGDHVWAQARDQLNRWSLTAPRDGSADKTDFTVTYADGNEYSGTFGLKFDDTDLPGHMRTFLGHLVEHRAHYERMDVNVDEAQEFLDKYEIGDTFADRVAFVRSRARFMTINTIDMTDLFTVEIGGQDEDVVITTETAKYLYEQLGGYFGD